METSLRLLIVGDSEPEAELLQVELRRAGYDPQARRVSHEDDLRHAFHHAPPDVVFADASSETLSPLRVIALLEEWAWDGPVIVMGREADESLVVVALHAGAGDYLTWNRLGRLKSAVGRELRAAQGRKRLEDAERSRRDTEERYRALIEEVPALTYISWADRFGSPPST